MFARMQFPNTVSEKALLAFAEYMYDGILNKDPDILIQMKIIAQRLDMKVFQKICNNQLQLVLPQNIPSPPISLMLSEPCSSSGLIDDDIPSDDINIHHEQKSLQTKTCLQVNSKKNLLQVKNCCNSAVL